MRCRQSALRAIVFLLTIAALSIRDAGARGASDQRPTAKLEARQDVGTWSVVESPLASPWWLNDIDMRAPDDGWAVGAAGRAIGAILHWNGTDWRRVPSPIDNSLKAVSMQSEQDGWAIANGFVAGGGSYSYAIRWNGSTWEQFGTTFPDEWHAVHAKRPGATAIVGTLGVWRWDGATWSRSNAPSSGFGGGWWGVSMLSSLDGWAVGLHGGNGNSILHWNGARWTAVPSPVSRNLRDVDMTNATDGWAVGDGGTILHWDGQAWSAAVSPTTSNLTSVSMISPDDGWVAGEDGTLLHWDGQDWSSVNSPTDRHFSSIAMVSSNDGWAVGDEVILRYRSAGQGSTDPAPTSTATPAPSPTKSPQPAFLPVALRHHPPLPYKPQLLPIVNAEMDGDFAVEWRSSLLAARYELEADDDVAFGSPSLVYEGTSLDFGVTAAGVGVHHYRVRGVNAFGSGAWSDPVSTVVLPPKAFAPVADAMIIDKFGSENVGSSGLMWVGYHHKGCLDVDATLGVVRSLVRFDLGAVPQGTPIGRAVLHLNVLAGCWSVSIDGQWRPVTAHRVEQPWDEGSVTWKSRPKEAEAVGSGRVHAASDLLGEVTLDVTEVVRGWIDGRTPNRGLMLRAPEGTNRNDAMVAVFGTREWEVAGERPFLTIDYGAQMIPVAYEGGAVNDRVRSLMHTKGLADASKCHYALGLITCTFMAGKTYSLGAWAR